MSARLPALLLAGCIGFAGLILFELGPAGGSDNPVSAPSPLQMEAKAPVARAQEPNVADLVGATVARPLFSPTRRAPETGSSDKSDELPDLRLTGIVIEPDRRIAIFAVPGAKPLIRSEGEALQDWRLDSISPEAVSLTGPAGTRTMEPKPDAKLVRPPPPSAAPAALPKPAVPSAANAAPPQAPPVAAPVGAQRPGPVAEPPSQPATAAPPPRRRAHDE